MLNLKQRNWNGSWMLGLLALTVVGCGSSDERQLASETGELPWNASGSGIVTDTYGLARVQEGNFYAESKTRPWSSYWFPHRDTSLYEPIGDEPSPLQKFDKWADKAKKLRTQAAAYERKNNEDGIFDDSWAGLCNAWSKASVMEPEPTKPVEIDGVKFSVFDLKALLIKSYENTSFDSTSDFKNYGQRFNGQRGDNFDDIYPDQFHRFLQAELFEKGHAFIMDRDAGIQVWNVPVYKAEITLSKDSSNPYVMHVHSTLGAAGTRDDVNFVGTWPVAYDYYYDLFGIPMADGTFEVKSGVWTGPSVDNHPDFVTAVPAKASHKSDNPELKPELINEIILKSRKPSSLFHFLY